MIRVTLQGADELRRRLGELAARGRNLRPLLNDIAEIIHAEVDQNFQAGGRDPQWPQSERVKKHGGQTLIDHVSGGLLSSIQTFVTGTSAGVGTNKAYAAIHNFGGPITRQPHSGSVRLRTDAKGNLLRQGLRGNLAIFARADHKRAVTRTFSSAGSTWQMPQREFMKITPAGLGKIESAAAAFLTSP